MTRARKDVLATAAEQLLRTHEELDEELPSLYRELADAFETLAHNIARMANDNKDSSEYLENYLLEFAETDSKKLQELGDRIIELGVKLKARKIELEAVEEQEEREEQERKEQEERERIEREEQERKAQEERDLKEKSGRRDTVRTVRFNIEEALYLCRRALSTLRKYEGDIEGDYAEFFKGSCKKDLQEAIEMIKPVLSVIKEQPFLYTYEDSLYIKMLNEAQAMINDLTIALV